MIEIKKCSCFQKTKYKQCVRKLKKKLVPIFCSYFPNFLWIPSSSDYRRAVSSRQLHHSEHQGSQYRFFPFTVFLVFILHFFVFLFLFLFFPFPISWFLFSFSCFSVFKKYSSFQKNVLASEKTKCQKQFAFFTKLLINSANFCLFRKLFPFKYFSKNTKHVCSYQNLFSISKKCFHYQKIHEL